MGRQLELILSDLRGLAASDFDDSTDNAQGPRSVSINSAKSLRNWTMSRLQRRPCST